MASAFLLSQLILFGIIVTYFFNLKLYFEERIATGILISLVWFGYLMFILSLIFGLGEKTILIFYFINIIAVILIFSNNFLSRIKTELVDLYMRLKQRSWLTLFGIIIFFCIFLSYDAVRLLTFENSMFYVSPIHAFGDISWHMGLINSFAFGANFPPQSPIMSSVSISYPFMVDFITAVFINPLGVSIQNAIALIGILLMCSMVIEVVYFVIRITSSKLVAILTLSLFIFNGGLGFIYAAGNFHESGKSLYEFLSHLSQDYTSMKDIGYWWINVVLSMLIPQRSFLFGFPLAILILRIFWDLSEKFNFRQFILGVMMASLLPLIHTHSLLAISIFLVWLTMIFLHKNVNLTRKVIVIGIFGILTSLSLSAVFLEQSHTIEKLLIFNFGWMHENENTALFYLKNFGIILFVIPISLFMATKKFKKLMVFGLIGQIWLIIPSFFIFQPWSYDNTKLFIYWYFTAAVLTGYFIAKLLWSKQLLKVSVAILILIVTTLSGLLDNIRLFLESATKYELYSQSAIQVGEFIKKNTPSNAVFLSVDKFDNPAVALAGRRAFLGFKGWAWSYGLDYSKKDRDLRAMLSGQDNALFKEYDISYTIIFNQPSEYEQVNKDYFKNRFKLVYDSDGYEIYEIK